MSRLEEIKDRYMEHEYDYALKSTDINWLIKQAERVEVITKHRDDILKANEYLNKQNQRYKQALKKLQECTYNEYEVLEIVDEALGGELE